MNKILSFIKKDVVLLVAWVLALASSFFIPPTTAYLEYIDWETLALLTSLMLVMVGFRTIGLFFKVGRRLLKKTKSTWALETVLIFSCFFTSMVITNDVALITFVPFAMSTLEMARLRNRIVPVVVLQTIAANLGSMMTPIGNPQNIYLYLQSGFSLGEYFQITLPYTGLSMALLLGLILLTKNQKIEAPSKIRLNQVIEADLIKQKLRGRRLPEVKRFWMYLVMFFICLLSLTRMVPMYYITAGIVIVILIADKSTIVRIDYGLLLTFIGFFIFVGNMAQVEGFAIFLDQLLGKNPILTAVATSQVISNVPAALLLSGFTSDWKALILGTNLGGLGTLIASMASLISYKYIVRNDSQEKGLYFAKFTIMNLLFLFILLGLAWIIEI